MDRAAWGWPLLPQLPGGALFLAVLSHVPAVAFGVHVAAFRADLIGGIGVVACHGITFRAPEARKAARAGLIAPLEQNGQAFLAVPRERVAVALFGIAHADHEEGRRIRRWLRQRQVQLVHVIDVP